MSSPMHDRIFHTPRKYLMADRLKIQYLSTIKEQIKANPGKAATIRTDQFKKILSDPNGFFDPEISNKTAHEALELFAEKYLRPEGFVSGYGYNDAGKEVFMIWLPEPKEEAI